MRTYGVPDVIVRWLTSFLCEHQQQVKICDIFSDWVTLRGGMSQGTWLGPLTFTILIDDLRSGRPTHKYVDDTTVTEIIEKGSVSEMQNTTATLVEWSELNSMNINIRKTKEMVMGSCGTEMNTLMISSTAVERVSKYKLLGVVVDSNLKWEDHVSAITYKAARRIWFLKKLKRAGASRPCILLPGGHPTRYGVRQPCLAFEPHEGTNESTRRCPAPGSSDHQRKHSV